MDLSPVSAATAARLAAAGLDPAQVAGIITRTIEEDLDGGVDVTSVSTVPAAQRSTVTFGARADGCLAGLDIACAVVEMVCGPQDVTIERARSDGDRVRKGDVIARVTAPTQRMLTAERTALNLLCHLSGVATATARWVDAVAGTGAVIRDTRKTTPMLRSLEKYAVRCGGGQNHRMSL
ncbi:MAG: nicotinate-nucleotide diphosphorylase, partial [Actinomycetota bacterium]